MSKALSGVEREGCGRTFGKAQWDELEMENAAGRQHHVLGLLLANYAGVSAAQARSHLAVSWYIRDEAQS